MALQAQRGEWAGTPLLSSQVEALEATHLPIFPTPDGGLVSHTPATTSILFWDTGVPTLTASTSLSGMLRK